jgi:hypothetical protein
VYFSLTNQDLRKNSRLFDFDEAWKDDPGFVKYDFKLPDKIPQQYWHQFDYVVIDPPFITDEVWELYAKAAKVVLMQETGSQSQQSISIVQNSNAEQTNPAENVVKASENTTVSDQTSKTATTEADPNPFKSQPKVNRSPPKQSKSLTTSEDKSSASATSTDNTRLLPGAKGNGPLSPSSHISTPKNMPKGKVLLSTIPEHEELLYQLFGASIRTFRPAIPTLIYQYVFYTNYDPTVTKLLDVANAEIDGDEQNSGSVKPKLKMEGMGSSDCN